MSTKIEITIDYRKDDGRVDVMVEKDNGQIPVRLLYKVNNVNDEKDLIATIVGNAIADEYVNECLTMY